MRHGASTRQARPDLMCEPGAEGRVSVLLSDGYSSASLTGLSMRAARGAQAKNASRGGARRSELSMQLVRLVVTAPPASAKLPSRRGSESRQWEQSKQINTGA